MRKARRLEIFSQLSHRKPIKKFSSWMLHSGVVFVKLPKVICIFQKVKCYNWGRKKNSFIYISSKCFFVHYTYNWKTCMMHRNAFYFNINGGLSDKMYILDMYLCMIRYFFFSLPKRNVHIQHLHCHFKLVYTRFLCFDMLRSFALIFFLLRIL